MALGISPGALTCFPRKPCFSVTTVSGMWNRRAIDRALTRCAGW